MTLGESFSSSSSSSSSNPLQAELPIDFLVIGGSITGLASAYALTRVGHRVLVLEARQDFFEESHSAGFRMPPNMSKVFYHWGLEDQVRKIGKKSSSVSFQRFESGESLGMHIWEDKVMKETGGDFVSAHHADLRRFLYEHALEAGAKFRSNCRVVAIDPAQWTVTLESGEVLKADVIVGADGAAGCSRQVILGGKREDTVNTGMVMYNGLIPIEGVLADPELASLVPPETSVMSVWFGNNAACLTFQLGGRPDIGIHLYVPEVATGIQTDVPPDVLIAQVEKAGAESRLKKLAALTKQIARVPVVESPDLADWVHNDGPLIIMGDAAHAMSPGSIQGPCMGLEDAAVLAKLFSHLLNYEQIQSFLYAFQDLRQNRCNATRMQELMQIYFISLPDGEQQRMRDAVFKERAAWGFITPGESSFEVGTYWNTIKEMFCYDAEDEADNWWISWGMLRERAKRTEIREDTMGILVNVNDVGFDFLPEQPSFRSSPHQVIHLAFLRTLS